MSAKINCVAVNFLNVDTVWAILYLEVQVNFNRQWHRVICVEFGTRYLLRICEFRENQHRENRIVLRK
jgi:hypothetical protein